MEYEGPRTLLLSAVEPHPTLQLTAELLHVWNDKKKKEKRWGTYFPSSTKIAVTSKGEKVNTSSSS